MATKKLSGLAEAILEMAEGQHRIGLMDDATYRKIAIRHLGEKANRLAASISAKESRPAREDSKKYPGGPLNTKACDGLQIEKGRITR